MEAAAARPRARARIEFTRATAVLLRRQAHRRPAADSADVKTARPPLSCVTDAMMPQFGHKIFVTVSLMLGKLSDITMGLHKSNFSPSVKYTTGDRKKNNDSSYSGDNHQNVVNKGDFDRVALSASTSFSNLSEQRRLRFAVYQAPNRAHPAPCCAPLAGTIPLPTAGETEPAGETAVVSARRGHSGALRRRNRPIRRRNGRRGASNAQAPIVARTHTREALCVDKQLDCGAGSHPETSPRAAAGRAGRK